MAGARGCRGAALAVALLAAGPARAADPLRLEGLLPAGGRSALTDRPGVLRFTLTNTTAEPRDARVLVFYPGRPDIQYGRDVWVPGKAQLTSWVPVGPPPPEAREFGREVKFVLADRTGGEARVLTPSAEQMRNRAVPYRKYEPSTAILTDEFVTDGADPAVLDRKESAAALSVQLARTFRAARGLSETVWVIPDRFLPPDPGAFDGIDQFVLAGNRLRADPLGAVALRRWVQGGGVLWVLLDRVEPATLAAVLGDDLGFEVAGRTTVTSVRIAGGSEPASDRPFDDPVELVRVLPAGPNTTVLEIDGWPAAFSRPLGRGRVVVTTLGPRAWHRPRLPRASRNASGDPPSPYADHQDLPVPTPALERLGLELFPSSDGTEGFRPDDLAPLVTAEIGYEVVGRPTAAAVLGGCIFAAAGVAAGLRGGRRPELAGWAGPAAAVGAAGVLVGLGTASREAVPPTAATAAIVEVAPGTGEGSAVGLAAVYRPDSGNARLGSDAGTEIDLDTSGVETRTRRRVLTDRGAWHWEDFGLPAGVRLGPFRATVPTGRLSATARFGPNGVEGELDAGPFADPADLLIRTPAGEPVAVRLAAGGTFTAGDVLPPDQYLTGGVLSDAQQRRGEVYRKLLSRPVARHLEGRDLLMLWAESNDLPFYAEDGARTVGHSLLVLPLPFERTPPDTAVTVPRGFIPAWSLSLNRPLRLPVEGSEPLELRLRFVLPPAVLPMTVERATLTLRVRAPSRRVTVTAGGVKLAEVESPTEPVRVEITDPKALQPDGEGGLSLTVAVGDRADDAGRPADVRVVKADDPWRIEAVGLAVSGRTK